jgi:hypothetical protein
VITGRRARIATISGITGGSSRNETEIWIHHSFLPRATGWSPVWIRTQRVPEMQTFRDRESYCATLAHEATHWTRHPSLLNRDLGRKRVGNAGYAMEQLTAEIGAASLCADLGITPETPRRSRRLCHVLAQGPEKRQTPYSPRRATRSAQPTISTAISRRGHGSADQAARHRLDLSCRKPCQMKGLYKISGYSQDGAGKICSSTARVTSTSARSCTGLDDSNCRRHCSATPAVAVSAADT